MELKAIILIFVLNLFTLQISFSQTLEKQINDTLVIENVNIIPMTREVILHHQNVVITHGKITSIKPSQSKLVKESSNVIDGTGKYLIPGFNEMHYHWRNKQGGIDRDFKLLIANGVTTVRNMAEYDWQGQMGIKDSIEKGEKFGPNYFTTGPYLNTGNLKTVGDAVTIVQDHKVKGYDYLKLADNLPKDVYLKVLEQAQIHNIDVIGHAQREMPLEYSLRMKSIEHMEEFVYIFNDKQRMDSLFLRHAIEQIKTSGIVITPTLVVFDMIIKSIDDNKFKSLKNNDSSQYILSGDFNYWNSNENPYRKDFRGKVINGVNALQIFKDHFSWMKSFTKMLADAKVPLMTGSDTFGFVVPGFSIHQEFEFLQKCGLKPFDILRATTVTPARYLNIIATEGTVSEGKNANLVLLNKNPLENIKNTMSIEGVILKGQWLSRERLDKMLNEVKSLNK